MSGDGLWFMGLEPFQLLQTNWLKFIVGQRADAYENCLTTGKMKRQLGVIQKGTTANPINPFSQ